MQTHDLETTLNIFITIPDFSLHGGIRVCIEWANRLTKWHNVTLYNLRGQPKPTWITISNKVQLATSPEMTGMDCLIITSPHSISMQYRPDCPPKVFIFMQMLEHLFRADEQWMEKCMEFYLSPHPMFMISKWNQDELFKMGRSGETIYIGNGVNLDDFPISKKPKDGKTILIEGWEAGNPSKDVKHLGPMAAQRLRGYGYRIIAYGSQPIKTLRHVPHEYHERPSLSKLNELYERATILIKATKFDARSCSTLEAATKGTVTARAIILGDDDLTDGFNCLRCDYKLSSLLDNARRLMRDKELREQLAANYYEYIEKYSWDYWMGIVNERLVQ